MQELDPEGSSARDEAGNAVPPSAPRAETERLVEALTGWIQALSEPEPTIEVRDEALIQALNAPAEVDLVGALSGLKQETGLQGRAFRELTRQVETLREEVSTSREGLEEVVIGSGDRLLREVSSIVESVRKTLEVRPSERIDPELLARSLEDARARGREESLSELLDVRDRLARGLTDARRRLAGLRGLRALFSDRTVLEAVVDGLRLSLDRLDDLLRRLEVVEVRVLQGSFDPVSMQALEVEERADLPEGHVIEVLRPGYVRHGRILRAAEVRVSRRPRG